MNIQALLLALKLQEDKDWEFKSAKGGLPLSLWESYSAMANTDGGVIVLGVKELEGGQFEVQGLDDSTRMERDFWSTINNRGKVSANLLLNADVRSEGIDDKTLLVVAVPRATRRQRPVFVGQNPLTGTYRRYNDGGYGERAGSGIDKIRQGWASQKWRWPLIEEQLQPDRVRLTLPMVSLLPEESLVRLRAILGEDMGGLNPREVQALVTADVEGSVTNQRLQQFMAEHTVDITRVLQELVGKGLLVKDGYGRWASYRLTERLLNSGYRTGGTPDITARDSADTAPSSPHKPGSSPRNGPGSPHKPSSSPRNGPGSPHKPSSSPYNGPSSPQDDPVLRDPALLAIAELSRTKERLLPQQTEEIILELCRGRFLTHRQIGGLLRRDAKRTKDRFLSKLVKDGRLRAKYADPTHPEQAYQTNPY